MKWCEQRSSATALIRSCVRIMLYIDLDSISICVLGQNKFYLSYDVASGSEIMPCNEINTPLAVYRFSGNVDVHNNVAYIMTKFYLF